MRSFAIVALIACLFAPGCVVPFPHSRVHDLGVTGRVVDGDTGDTIQNARIESTSDEQTGSRVSVDTTDANGQFLVKPTRRLHGGRLHSAISLSLWPDFDIAPPMRVLTISATEYQTRRVSVNAQESHNPNLVSARLEPNGDTLRDCIIRLSRIPSTQPVPYRN